MNWREFFRLTELKITLALILVGVYIFYLFLSSFALDTISLVIPLEFYTLCSKCVVKAESFNISSFFIDFFIVFAVSYLISCLVFIRKSVK